MVNSYMNLERSIMTATTDDGERQIHNAIFGDKRRTLHLGMNVKRLGTNKTLDLGTKLET